MRVGIALIGGPGMRIVVFSTGNRSTHHVTVRIGQPDKSMAARLFCSS